MAFRSWQFCWECIARLHRNFILKRSSTQQARQAKAGRKAYPVLGARGASTPINHTSPPASGSFVLVCVASQMSFWIREVQVQVLMTIEPQEAKCDDIAKEETNSNMADSQQTRGS